MFHPFCVHLCFLDARKAFSTLIAAADDWLISACNVRDLLRKACTHRSEVDDGIDSNERLEFLGDAVLGLVVADKLYKENPQWVPRLDRCYTLPFICADFSLQR